MLLVFGLYTLFGSEEAEEERLASFTDVRGPAALLLSISLDESWRSGSPLGVLRAPVPVIALIAVQAFVMAQQGLRLGGRLSERSREGTERVAGLALTGLALVLLAENILS